MATISLHSQRYLYALLACIGGLLMLVSIAPTTQAQNDPNDPSDDVWVTTQFNVKLRSGPGLNWDELTTIPFGETFKAIGRSVNSDWIQIIYAEPLPEGASTDATIDGITYGWMYTNLLRYSGDVLALPVDGIETQSLARRSGPLITLYPEGTYWRTYLDLDSTVTGLVAQETEAELVGRVGGGDYYWLQFRLGNEFYWVPTWLVEPPNRTRQLLNGSYLYAYGRVLDQVREVANRTNAAYRTLNGRWRDLDAGFAATCNSIPALIIIEDDELRPIDISRSPQFEPLVTALNVAIENVNNSRNIYNAMCNRPIEERAATPTDVQQGLMFLEEADLNLSLIYLLLGPLSERDPFSG